MAFTAVTGIEKVDRDLRQFTEKVQQQVSRSAVRAGAMVIVNHAQQLAPVGKNTKQRQKAIADAAGKKGRRALRLKQSVGIKSDKLRGHGVVGLKVTVAAFHGHFVTLGVQDRQKGRKGKHALAGRSTRRGKGGSLEDTDRIRIGGFFAWKGPGADPRNKGTGKMKANPFFRRAHKSVKHIVKIVIVEKLVVGIRKQAAATFKGTGA